MVHALPPQKRRELLHLLISASPYRGALSRHLEEIDRAAAEHPQITQIMSEVYSEISIHSGSVPRDPEAKKQYHLLLDFLEFIYFSTPEAYKGISGAR
ncbi:MAG: hypothetical protein K9K66_03980 [Desulfarculaceae bacterium]|nr:hypothetical protein [Desulfarculaceae bacterium]MCF8073200.1 hypothetical protein [Desulfarculaceae bacterium]MCF8100796.1 hypothetical protein [Desulfarculaceae bacterium]MCF8118443.1 hypothetical protein [Desulfarculaceae bacterium]